MRRVTLRSIWEHKRRLVSTITAIVLGVAFMTGTFIFADTIDKVFDDLFSDVNANIDVQVQGVTLFSGGGFGGPDARKLLDESLVDVVAGVDGVEAATGFVQTIGFGSTNRILDRDGTPIGSSNGPPTLFQNWAADDILNPFRLLDGSRAPAADDELVLNVAAARDAGLSVGDQVTALSQFGESTYTLVGVATFGEADSAAGAVNANFTLPETQRLAGLDGIQVVVARGDGSASQQELTDAVAAVLPPDAEAITGEEAAAQDASDVQEGFSFFRQILLVFGAIALLVGTFIIANTFSILIAQRTRELALLRAIGASRRQVLTSVLLEAAVIGLISAVLGLIGGVLLAIGVTALLDAAGADLPSNGLVVGSNTVIISLVIGLGVTLVSAMLPAIQATKVAPLAALRESSAQRAGVSRVRIGVGAVATLVSLFLLSAAWRGGGSTDDLPTVGLGAMLLIVSAIIVGPALAEPSVRILGGWLPKVRGITGVLARENAARSPKRTSATASALLIGVTLIGFITIFGASARASIDAEVERGFAADLVIQSSSGGFGPPGVYPAAVADDVAALDGVKEVLRIGFTPAQVTYGPDEQSVTFVTAIDPETALNSFSPRMTAGSVADLQPGGVVVDVGIVEDNGLSLGDTISITGPEGASADFVIQAVSDDFSLLGWITISTPDLGQIVSERQLAQTFVTVEDGVDVAVVQDRIETALERVPDMEVLDKEGFVGSLTDQITSFLTLINGLLLLSIVIALIGIANTLSLSIHERTRELGLLRAVGMTRRQLRSAIRWEAVLIAVLGTLVGLGVGLLCSWAVLTALQSFGLGQFVIPFGSLVFVIVATAVLGVLAAVRPARRAARLDVLAAIATE